MFVTSKSFFGQIIISCKVFIVKAIDMKPKKISQKVPEFDEKSVYLRF